MVMQCNTKYNLSLSKTIILINLESVELYRVSKKKETRNKSCGDYSQAVEIFMTNFVQFFVKLALFKRDFLHDARS